MPGTRARHVIVAGAAVLALGFSMAFAPSASAKAPDPTSAVNTLLDQLLPLGGAAQSAPDPGTARHESGSSDTVSRKHRLHVTHVTKRGPRHHASRHVLRRHVVQRRAQHTTHPAGRGVPQHLTATRPDHATQVSREGTAQPLVARAVTADSTTATPQATQQASGGVLGGLLGGLLGGAVDVVNGAVAGVAGVARSATGLVGSLLGGPGDSSSPPPPPTSGSNPPPTSSGSSSSAPPPSTSASSPPPASGSSTGPAPSHQVAGEALPAPADSPSIISPRRTQVPVVDSGSPKPTPTPNALNPVLPVALTSAPGGWVLLLAIGLFAVAVVFMVLGAGYRGRRTR